MEIGLVGELGTNVGSGSGDRARDAGREVVREGAREGTRELGRDPAPGVDFRRETFDAEVRNGFEDSVRNEAFEVVEWSFLAGKSVTSTLCDTTLL